MRRLVSSIVVAALLAMGLSFIEATGGPALSAHADVTWGTITGSVTFSAAPTWNTGDRRFNVQLIDTPGYHVDTDLVPITYSYEGSGGFTITYPIDHEDGGCYNDYFCYSNYFRVRIDPVDPAYPWEYVGGTQSYDEATQIALWDPTTHTAVGNTALSILASISGTLTIPSGVPAGQVEAIATSSGEGNHGQAIVNSDGSYHVVGLNPGTYNVGFSPAGTGSGPGAGTWWNSKPSLVGAGLVTVAAHQQKAGINQTLPAGGTITGRLTDSEGNVVHGAVAIYSSSGTSDSGASLVQEMWVAEDGTYRFWGLPFGSYKLGFDTGVRPPVDSMVSAWNLHGSARPVKEPAPAVDTNPGWDGATGADGEIVESSYPYKSAWYLGGAASFTTAKSVSVSASKPIVGNINGILPLDPAFLALQEYERIATNASEKSATCKCADPVDTASGEFSESTQDLGLPGVGIPVQLDRSYSSALANVDGPFGWGSSSSLAAHLAIVPGSDDNPHETVVVTQENGATVTFTTMNGGQQYMAPSRVNSTLVKDYSHNQWVFTRNDNDVFRFTNAGAVVSHRDLHGNVVTYGTGGSGEVTTIDGSGGREIALTWTDGHITSAVDSAGRTVSYAYDGDELSSFTAADGRVTAFDYDSDHRTTTVTAPGGGLTTNVYDNQGRVTSQTDPLGRETTFAYSGGALDSSTTVTNPTGVATKFHYVAGSLISQTEAFGTTSASTTTTTYDAALNVVKHVDALGKSTTMTYDGAGNMLTITDPLGHTTTFQYDDLHDVVGVTDPLGRVSTATYDATGLKTSSTSPSGATRFWSYNADGTLASSTDPLGNAVGYGYDSFGLSTSTTDPLGRTTSTGYDAAGHPTSKTDPSGATSGVTVDALGRPLETTDALGHVSLFDYDDYGNGTTVTAADGTVTTNAFDLDNEPVSQTDALGHVTSITYTVLGKVATTTDALGGVTTTTYDLLGRPTLVKDPKGLNTRTTYNKNGQIVQVLSPAGNLSKASYDVAGRKISSTDPLGNVTSYGYDAANQLVSLTDPLGRVTTTAYDLDGRPTAVTGPDGHTETTSYDAAGHQTAFTDADGAITGYTYDTAGQLTSRTAPGGLVAGYAYDSTGRVSTLTKPDGSAVVNEYDSAGELLSATPSAGIANAFTYDELGRRTTMTDETGTTSYQYSDIGQPISITNGAGLTVTHGYDAAGRNTTLGYPGGKSVTYAYDADGRITSLTDWAHHKTTFTWSTDSQVTKQTDPNKVTTTTTYNKNDQVTAIGVVNTTAPATTLASYQYVYDAASELTSTTLADPLHMTAGGDTTTYGYDTRGQLASDSSGGSFSSTPAGLLSQTPGGVSTYNSSLQITTIDSTSSALSSSFAYGGNGARASESTTSPAGTSMTTYAHSWSGALASVSTATASIGYTTDGDGLRQSRTSGGGTQQWLWDPTTEIPVLLSDGTFTYLYGPGLVPVAQVDGSGAIQYLRGDNVGSVRLITNGAGAVVGTKNYSPYGSAISTGTASNFGYADSWTDSATGLDYLRAREYDPSIGQFLQVDPALDNTRQAYAYALNNPLEQTDPTGLIPGGCPPGAKCPTAASNKALNEAIGEQFKIAGAGFSDGSAYGISMLFNDDYDCYGGNAEFWIEYGLGVVVQSALTIATAGGSLEGELAIQGATRAAEGAAEAAANASRVEDLAVAIKNLGFLDEGLTNPANVQMLNRIEEALKAGKPLTAYQENFLTHEVAEFEAVGLGFTQGEAHEIALSAHPPFSNFDPDVVLNDPFLGSNANWRNWASSQ